MIKWMKYVLIFILTFSLITPVIKVEAAVNKHYTVNVNKLDVREKPSPKAKVIGSLKKGTVVFVYNAEPGGWSKIKYNGKAGYVASSGFKSNTSVKSFKNYQGNWFTSANAQPGIGVELEFISNNKANIDLYGVWWSMADGSNARESHAFDYTITFNKNGIGKVTFREDRAGNVGIATVKLVGSYVYLNVEYPPYEDNKFLDSYIYEGNSKLVRRNF